MNNQFGKNSNSALSSVYFFDRRIDFIKPNELITLIFQACQQRKKMIVSNYNIHGFNWSMLSNNFYSFQKNSDIALCDGMGIIKGLQLLGIHIPHEYKVSLTSFVPKLLQECQSNNLSIFLLGSTPGNIEQALNIQSTKFPNVRMSGHHGYFDKDDFNQNQFVINTINQFKPDILIIGMGMPIQELWLQKNHSQLKFKVAIPCGAVIDRLAGLVSAPPKWISNAGLEWLFRLVKEPKRLYARYLLGNPLFFLIIVWAKFHMNKHNKGFLTVNKSELHKNIVTKKNLEKIVTNLT